jgi:isopentenyl diphosphate isomerase/L-lactate dehydrogenase-like FMN-dependent dehydrogenase
MQSRRGMSGVVVSNRKSRILPAVYGKCRRSTLATHGGRQVDGSIASLDVLPEIVAAVGSKIDIYK